MFSRLMAVLGHFCLQVHAFSASGASLDGVSLGDAFEACQEDTSTPCWRHTHGDTFVQTSRIATAAPWAAGHRRTSPPAARGEKPSESSSGGELNLSPWQSSGLLHRWEESSARVWQVATA
eukprot:Skav218279  [mRNA]  locus=scaffold2035:421593:425266:- [translate_table: standard]